MWQRFTEEARKVVYYALEAAQQHGADGVDETHLLLGLTRVEATIASRTLQAFGLTLLQVRAEMEKCLTKSEARPRSDLVLTRRSKRVIDLAYREALEVFKNDYIGVEHLLLGFIADQEGLAGKILRELGLELDPVRRETEAVQALEPRPEIVLEPRKTQRQPDSPPPADPWAGIDAFARRAVVFAEMEALKRGQAFLSPEHLLLGLLREPESPAVQVLKSIGFASETIGEAVAAQCRDSGSPLRGESTLSPASGHAFRIAYQEQVRLRGKDLGAEHLLLGLLIEPDGIARRILEGLGIDADRVRIALMAAAREDQNG